jgi:ornithine cyclodeaminase
MRVVTLDEIQRVLPDLDLMPDIEAGFAAYSRGDAVVPPVGELLLDGGDVHIKYGYLKGDQYYVIKIASGFYDNPKLGLPSGNGLMLLFDQITGEAVAMLLDEGCLTDIRTAVAGAIAARHLAPRKVDRIGIVGSGIQARQQLRLLETVTPCRDVLVWSKFTDELPAYQKDMEDLDFRVETTSDATRILPNCNLVVTCTPSTEPILFARELQPGTHITAVGSDTPGKQELDTEILARAEVVVADSIPQCLIRGEIAQALKTSHVKKEQLLELGNIISGAEDGRTSESQISVADLTGVAVQDIKIASAVYRAITST